MPAGNIQVDFEGMLLARIVDTRWRDTFPVEAYARRLGQFDTHQHGMPRDAAREALVKIDRDAEDDDCRCGAYYEQPPAYQEISQDAQTRAAKKNAYARPTETIALTIQYMETTLQPLYLSLDGF